METSVNLSGKQTRADRCGNRQFFGPTLGIRAVSTYGHTKGHTTYSVESKGQRLAALGDLMHVAAVQFPNPSVTIQFDTDPKLAAVARKKVYADVATQGYWLAAAHLPFPGVGHIRVDGKGYVYVPANYAVPR